MKIFWLGEANFQRLGFTSRMREMVRRELPKYFPEHKDIILMLEKASRGSFRWNMEANGERFYVKMDFGRGPYSRKLKGRREAMFKFVKTQRLTGIYQIQQIFASHGEWVALEVLKFIEGTVTLDELLKKKMASNGQEATLFFRSLGRKIAESVEGVHTTKPSSLEVGGQIFLSDREKVYKKAIRDILKRMDVYMPVNEEHPLISRGDRLKLQEGLRKILRGWTGESNRLCLVHGDLHGENILVPSNSGIILIDFSPRVHLGEPRWDDGRLVADLLEKVGLGL